MKEELHALHANETWTLVPLTPNMNHVGCKWVFRIKYRPDGSVLKYKARLVAKGFHQTAGLDFFDTYSPVVKSATIKVIFSLAVFHGWDIQQVDINNAFLNGDLHELVFMEQPPSFTDPQFPLHACKLKKALYGIKQAPRSWFTTLKNALLSWGFHNSTADISLFIHHSGSIIMYLLVYVDDILLTSNSPAAIRSLIHHLHKTFALKVFGSLNYFIGFEAYRDSSGLYLTQTKYVTDFLSKTCMADSKPCDTPMCTSSKLSAEDCSPFEDLTLYRSTIGALQYLTHTRPDIAFAVNRLSQFLKCPSQVH
ncbi:hypothetical protein ACOSQ4_022173 [Xanthoceras sorbifolium]